MKLQDLKEKAPGRSRRDGRGTGVENASTLRKQDLHVRDLEGCADDGDEIIGAGTIEVHVRRFRLPALAEANYLAGPDDIYVSPNQVRQFGLRTGDTVEGEIRAPKDGERYFALTKLLKDQFRRSRRRASRASISTI